MNAVDAIAFVAAIAGVALAWVLVERARAGWVPASILRVVAVACLVLLAFVTLSDWPAEWLNEFWAEHSIVGGLISTLLLVGAGLLGLEAQSLQEQQRLSDAMAGTAFAGLVDPVIDVDIALALLTRPASELPAGWDRPAKPLRWIRDIRDTGLPTALWTIDPETVFDQLDSIAAEQLIDQSIRRVVGAARNWAALAAGSLEGRAILAAFGGIRNDLTSLKSLIRSNERGALIDRWIDLRADIQQIAAALELVSGSPDPRPLVLGMPVDDIRRWRPDRASGIERIIRSVGRSGTTTREIRELLPASAHHGSSPKGRIRG